MREAVIAVLIIAPIGCTAIKPEARWTNLLDERINRYLSMSMGIVVHHRLTS
jgi:hypothetical protein